MLSYQIKNDFKNISLEDWEKLLKESSTTTVFQTPEYCQAWWKVFVHNEKQLCLIVIYDEKELVGVASLRIQNEKVTFIGTDRVGSGGDLVTDFGDIVAKKGREKEVWVEVINALKALGTVKEIVFDYIRESSPSLAVLKAQDYEISEMIDNATPDVAPYLDLPKTWEEYLVQLGRKERHELRRKLRRLDEHGYTIEKAKITPENINEFIRLHKASTIEKDRFMTSQMEDFFRKLSLDLNDNNLIDLVFMRFGNENISATLAFIWDNEYWLYNSGFDRKYDNLAVGFLLKALTIKMAIEKGYKRYSFLRGNERYKYDLGGKDEKLYKIKINF